MTAAPAHSAAASGQRSRHQRGALGWSLATLLATLLASAALAGRQSQRVAEYRQAELDLAARHTADEIVERFGRFESGLRGARGVVVAAEPHAVTRRAFRLYSESRDLAAEFPGALGFGLIRRVPEAEEADFLARARGDGAPDFAIRALAPHDGERWVIQYIEPVDRNAAALGLDIASEPTRRAAAIAAMTSGRATLTAPIALVQDRRGQQRGFLALLAVYRPGAPLSTTEQRERATVGWSYAPVVIDEVLASLDDARDLAVTLSDVTIAERAVVMRVGAVSGPRVTAVAQREVMGRRWTIEVARVLAGTSDPLLRPGAVFGLGAAAGVLLAAVTLLAVSGLARRRETWLARARLATIVDSSPDAIVGQDLDGRIMLWNAAAERLFGYPSDAVLGRPVADLLLPDDRRGEDADLRLRVIRDGQVGSFDTQRRHRDGRVVDVAITAGVIRDASGGVVGMAKVIHAIAERKQHERALAQLHAELEDRVVERTAELERTRGDLQTVLDAMPSMIGYWDSRLINRFANRAYGDWFAVDPHRMRGTTMQELLGDALYERNRPYIEAVLRGEPQTFERTLRHTDGREREVLAQYLPDTSGGVVRGFYVLVHDVSELAASRRELAAALREHKALLDAITRHVLYSLTDAHGRITDANDNVCRISGYSREELIGQNYRIVNSGTHPPEFWRAVWDTILAGQAWRGEICNRTKAGELYWVDSVITPMIGADGQIERYLSLRYEITDRKRAEAALRARERQMQLVIGAFPGRLAYWDRDLRCTFAGGAILPGSADVDASLAASEDLGADLTEPELRSLWQGAPQARERTIEALGGSARHYLIRYLPDRDADHVRGFVAAAADVTELKETQRVLEDRTRQAERASAAKGEFLANISHEIRTPLNAIIGMHYLLAASELDAEQRDMVHKAEVAGRSLLGIINNVLDLSKIEAGEVAFASEQFELAELLREVAAVFQPQALAKQLALRVDLAGDVPALVLGDPVRVRQMVTNLVGNACKFTERGEIQIRATLEDQAGGSTRVRIAVRDTGIGIAAEVLPTLFTPFVQADASTSRRYGGTGLGLSIVRQLAELMGGEAGVTSQAGAGSEFWIILPFADADTQRAIDPPLIEILVVDDHVPDALALAAVGRSLGWRVTAVSSGPETLALLAERLRLSAAIPDAFVVAWQMPEMDGVQLIGELRALLGARMPTVVMVSAYERGCFDARAAGVAADAMLDKPVSVSALFNAINSGIARQRGHTADIVRNTRFGDRNTRWLPGVRVLLIDDNDINLEVARRVLEQAGADAEVCTSGEAALEVLRARPAHFEIVLMDVQMTGLDGLATTRRVRDELGLTELPVIALTAGALLEERRRALAAGMNDFLSKPFEPDTLVRVVRRWVEKQRDGTVPARGVTGRLPVLAAPTEWPLPPIDGIDAGRIAAGLGMSPMSYLGLMRGLLREFGDLATPASALLPSGHAALAVRVHRLAGGAGQLGAGAVAAASIALERALRNCGAEPPPQALYETLARALSALADACAPALAVADAAEPTVAPAPSADEPTLTAEQCAELLQLLAQRNLDVLDRMEALKPELRRALGPRFIGLTRAANDLDFATAQQILQNLATSR